MSDAAGVRPQGGALRSAGGAAVGALRLLASLRLTVALFAAAIFIVFAGTLAQVDRGIWTVVDQYFRAPLAFIEFQIFFPRTLDVPGGFWFPGGWLIGGLLLANILAAHVIRFKIQARGARLAAGLAVVAAGGVLVWLIAAGVFHRDIAATEDEAFWRVLERLGKGGGAALVLMLGCWLLFRRRGGIVLLHGGIILLFISEFITGMWQVEGRMRIEAGESKNYVERSRQVELALIDRSDPQADHVVVVPGARLVEGQIVQHELLPVTIEVLDYMRNSDVFDVRGQRAAGMPNPATTGAGLRAVAVERPEVSGTDVDQRIDIPAAYLRLRDRASGAVLGTYLATLFLDQVTGPQTVTVGGRTYDLELRFTRDYKPYSIELLEFRHDRYVGTDKPKNFSSLVRVVDPEHGVDRTVKIWMNNPLRYRGETFYQASFEPGKNLTILQVVRNDGWMLPYLACMIVGVGMTVHFTANLVDFLRRRVAL